MSDQIENAFNMMEKAIEITCQRYLNIRDCNDLKAIFENLHNVVQKELTENE